jgi:hypothetical protein
MAGAIMCRSIRPLFNYEPAASEAEIEAAALQYVRKISGFTAPAGANVAAFEAAVDEIAAASKRLVASLKTKAAPRNREVEAAKKRLRYS